LDLVCRQVSLVEAGSAYGNQGLLGPSLAPGPAAAYVCSCRGALGLKAGGLPGQTCRRQSLQHNSLVCESWGRVWPGSVTARYTYKEGYCPTEELLIGTARVSPRPRPRVAKGQALGLTW